MDVEKPLHDLNKVVRPFYFGLIYHFILLQMNLILFCAWLSIKLYSLAFGYYLLLLIFFWGCYLVSSYRFFPRYGECLRLIDTDLKLSHRLIAAFHICQEKKHPWWRILVADAITQLQSKQTQQKLLQKKIYHRVWLRFIVLFVQIFSLYSLSTMEFISPALSYSELSQETIFSLQNSRHNLEKNDLSPLAKAYDRALQNDQLDVKTLQNLKQSVEKQLKDLETLRQSKTDSKKFPEKSSLANSKEAKNQKSSDSRSDGSAKTFAKNSFYRKMFRQKNVLKKELEHLQKMISENLPSDKTGGEIASRADQAAKQTAADSFGNNLDWQQKLPSIPKNVDDRIQAGQLKTNFLNPWWPKKYHQTVKEYHQLTHQQ